MKTPSPLRKNEIMTQTMKGAKSMGWEREVLVCEGSLAFLESTYACVKWDKEIHLQRYFTMMHVNPCLQACAYISVTFNFLKLYIAHTI